jgi:ribose 5-phosphate isomerase B
MRVFVGTDHAGLEFKDHLKHALAAAGHEPVDCGAFEYDAQDDYPPFCFEVGERVVADPGSLGVVIGGSGNGEQMAANKVPGVRAALVWNSDTARLAREHNDANVVSIGARQHAVDEATDHRGGANADAGGGPRSRGGPGGRIGSHRRDGCDRPW